jgi:hypothetical protein
MEASAQYVLPLFAVVMSALAVSMALRVCNWLFRGVPALIAAEGFAYIVMRIAVAAMCTIAFIPMATQIWEKLPLGISNAVPLFATALGALALLLMAVQSLFMLVVVVCADAYGKKEIADRLNAAR